MKNSKSIKMKCFQLSQNKSSISIKVASMISTLRQFHFCGTFHHLDYYSCLKEKQILACWYFPQNQQPSSSAAQESNWKSQSQSISLEHLFPFPKPPFDVGPWQGVERVGRGGRRIRVWFIIYK